MKTLLLTKNDVRSLLTMELAIPAVQSAFLAHGRGETKMPSKVYLALPEYGGDFRAMPSYVGKAAGVKWVNSHPQNPPRHGLPSVMGVYILSDPETAFPLAILDATLLTAARTGAAAAVASKVLAKPSPRRIGFVGSGVQARFLLEAHRTLFGPLEVMAADAAPAAAEEFAREVGGRVVSVQEACGCDIVCTSTPSYQPVVRGDWVGPGTHINAMGADAPGKQEIEASILREAKVVIDDYEQATHSGEVNVPLHAGAYQKSSIYGTLGEILAGHKPGREGDEITLFDSTGLGVQDAALAYVMYEQAKAQGVGTTIDLLSLETR